jgi:hypothetical protein
MMGESPKDSEHAFTHMLTVFSVSAGMIGVCPPAIGLVKIVSQTKGVETLCDDLIAIDAMIFGLAALLGFRGLRRFVHHQIPLSPRLLDWSFLSGMALMIVICGIFAWNLL